MVYVYIGKKILQTTVGIIVKRIPTVLKNKKIVIICIKNTLPSLINGQELDSKTIWGLFVFSCGVKREQKPIKDNELENGETMIFIYL